MAQLEALVGVQLFERTTRRVRMTAAGEDFLPRAREALAAVDLAIATAHRHADGAAGRLAIGLSSTTGLPATPQLLRAFGERYPDVALDVRHFTFTDPYAGLLTGETDVAIVRPPFARALELHALASEPRYVTLPSGHPLADREEVVFAEIADEPWMNLETDHVWCGSGCAPSIAPARRASARSAHRSTSSSRRRGSGGRSASSRSPSPDRARGRDSPSCAWPTSSRRWPRSPPPGRVAPGRAQLPRRRGD